MENVIEVNVETLELDIETMTELLAELKNCVEEINNIMSELGNIWTSQSRNKLMNGYKMRQLIFNAMFKNVEAVLDSMQNAKSKYARCENTVYQKVTAIKI